MQQVMGALTPLLGNEQVDLAGAPVGHLGRLFLPISLQVGAKWVETLRPDPALATPGRGGGLGSSLPQIDHIGPKYACRGPQSADD